MNQIINVDDITIELIPYTNYYMQWERIAMWQFQFNIYLMMREAIEDLNNKEGFNNG